MRPIRPLPARLLAGGAAIALVTVAVRGAARVEVDGTSMLPTLEPGDRLLVRRCRRPRPGDIVSVADPREPTRILVKRVLAVSGAGLDVRGDNPGASTDSRSFGSLPLTAATGRVIYRYHPPARRGRLGRRLEGSW